MSAKKSKGVSVKTNKEAFSGALHVINPDKLLYSKERYYDNQPSL